MLGMVPDAAKYKGEKDMVYWSQKTASITRGLENIIEGTLDPPEVSNIFEDKMETGQ